MLHLMIALALSGTPVPSAPASRADPPNREARSTTAAGTQAPGEHTDDVGLIYDELLSKSLADRKVAFAKLSSSTKSAVWAHHLLTALAQHPEFTPDQRAVIQDFLSVLSPALYDTRPDDATWHDVVDAPLRPIAARAKKLFKPALVLELFGQLGATDAQHPATSPDTITKPAGSKTPAASSSGRLRPQPNDGGTCECSTASDMCNDPSGLGIVFCANIAGVTDCTFKSGWPACGLAWAYPCNGMCVTNV